MPSYQEMYLTMMRACEEAMGILIAAQQECEETYLSAPQPELVVLPHREEEAPFPPL